MFLQADGASGGPLGKLEAARSAPPNQQVSPEVRYDGKTAIITGSGGGLGRSYALLFARLGANIVVNDVSEKSAKAVVDEIIKGSRTRATIPVVITDNGTHQLEVKLRLQCVRLRMAMLSSRPHWMPSVVSTSWSQTLVS